MPSPLTHGLLPMACALSSARTLVKLTASQWRALALICFVLGNSPDIDLIPASLWPAHYHTIHRSLGHNAFALVLWITLGTQALRRWVGSEFRGKTGWIFSAALVLSHVLLDGSADTIPGTAIRVGVPLLWPFSNWQFLTPLEIFGGYRLVPASHPIVATLLTPGFWGTVLAREVVCTLFIGTLWFGATKVVEKRKRPPSVPVRSTDEELPLAS